MDIRRPSFVQQFDRLAHWRNLVLAVQAQHLCGGGYLICSRNKRRESQQHTPTWEGEDICSLGVCVNNSLKEDP